MHSKMANFFEWRRIVEDYWTICNVKCAGMAERKNDARMAEFRSPSDRRLDFDYYLFLFS